MRKLAATMSSLNGFSHAVAGISYVSRFPVSRNGFRSASTSMYLSKFARAWACPVRRTCILPQGFQHSQQYPRHPLKAVEMAVWRAVEVDHRRPTLCGMSAGGGEEPSKMSSCVRLACPYCDRVQTQFPQAKPARSQKRLGATCRSALNFIRF